MSYVIYELFLMKTKFGMNDVKYFLLLFFDKNNIVIN